MGSATAGVAGSGAIWRLRDCENHERENRHRFLVRSASGSWHKDCPEGMVLCSAQRASDGEESTWLVPSSEYRAGLLSFVIDESRHQRVDGKPFRKQVSL